MAFEKVLRNSPVPLVLFAANTHKHHPSSITRKTKGMVKKNNEKCLRFYQKKKNRNLSRAKLIAERINYRIPITKAPYTASFLLSMVKRDHNFRVTMV